MEISDLISRMGDSISPVLAIVLGISAGVIIAVTAIISGHIRSYRERHLMANLIQDMVDRGMPADEIERLAKLAAIKMPDDEE